MNRKNAAWSWLSVGAIGGALVVSDGGSTQLRIAPEVEASKFILRDEEGRVRAELSADDAGTYFRVFDARMRPLIALGTSDGETAELSILGTERSEEGDDDEPGFPQIRVGVMRGVALMYLTDSKGRPRVQASVSEGPAIQVIGEKLNVLVELSADGQQGRVRVLDTQGNIIWTSPD